MCFQGLIGTTQDGLLQSLKPPDTSSSYCFLEKEGWQEVRGAIRLYSLCPFAEKAVFFLIKQVGARTAFSPVHAESKGKAVPCVVRQSGCESSWMLSSDLLVWREHSTQENIARLGNTKSPVRATVKGRNSACLGEQQQQPV